MSDLDQKPAEDTPDPSAAQNQPPRPQEPAPTPAEKKPGRIAAWFASGATLARGNRLRPVRGGLLTAIGGLVALVTMSTKAQYRWGVAIGILGVAVASVGILDLLGTFDDPDDRVAKSTPLRAIGSMLGGLIGAFLATLLLVGLAAKGRLSIGVAAVLVPTAFIALVAFVYWTGAALGPWATDEDGNPRPLWRRHGFWVVLAGTLLYLPMNGSYSLSDPWETHYGEVAREMLARNDWISTWWAQDGWFWSKPVLDFWMQAAAMGIFGVDYRPGQMLADAAYGNTPWPEWAVRMPVFVLTIIALYVLYKAVAKVFGRRAGLIGALVLATMPQWYLLAHQTITDMPLVATLSTSMGLLMLGMHTDPEQKVKAWEITAFGRRVRLTGYHLVLGVILMSALPQILYLCSRNLDFQVSPIPWFRPPHPDQFLSGSAGNCGLPGNEACNPQQPVNPHFQPWMQGLLWLGVLGLVLSINWGERRRSRLYFLAAWYFAAVATMGKGPAGFGLPICVTFTYLAATRQWSRLLTVEVISGLLIILAVAIPWYFAMYIRHGQPFTDRLIFHDMYKRAMTHVHDTNEGDDVSFRFYVWQLGYALFPWTGLVPAGLVFWTRRSDDASRGQGDVSVFMAMWFVFAFGLFTAMLTKFHHYIFPAVPPAAMLTGIVVDRMLGKAQFGSPKAMFKYLGGLGVSALLFTYGVFRLFPGRIDGFRGDDGGMRPPSFPIAAVCMAAAVALAIVAVRWFGGAEEAPAEESDEKARIRIHEDLMLGGVAIAAAVVVALAGRDMFFKGESGDINGQARLLHLFTYNYRRPWPDTLDWNGVLVAFTIVSAGLCALLAVRSWRRHVTVLLTATALGWAVWGLDVYLVRTSPHWGQREILETYYKKRANPDEPIVAYQMNWKGENFYAGNRVPAFVSSGTPFTNWVKAQQDKGIRTFFFVTEHTRVGALKGEAGNPPVFETVTDKRLNNKFALVRAKFEASKPPPAQPPKTSND
jgi:4-amino-4-deoxy-L-arabinose transferase-like glycosyltransferase